MNNLRYESYVKLEKGNWLFVGWYPMRNEEFCIETKENKNFIYKTYKWLNGKIEEYRFRKGGVSYE